MPAAAAFKMPSKYHMAEILRRDLADARAKWIDDARDDADERERRQRLANAYATGTSNVDSGGQSEPAPVELKTLDSSLKSGKIALSAQDPGSGLLAELADAMDSKSIARKGVSVRLR